MLSSAQFFITILIIIVSFAMIVAVPVVAATPNAWEDKEGIGSTVVYGGAAIWSVLVILAGLCSIRI